MYGILHVAFAVDCDRNPMQRPLVCPATPCRVARMSHEYAGEKRRTVCVCACVCAFVQDHLQLPRTYCSKLDGRASRLKHVVGGYTSQYAARRVYEVIRLRLTEPACLPACLSLRPLLLGPWVPRIRSKTEQARMAGPGVANGGARAGQARPGRTRETQRNPETGQHKDPTSIGRSFSADKEPDRLPAFCCLHFPYRIGLVGLNCAFLPILVLLYIPIPITHQITDRGRLKSSLRPTSSLFYGPFYPDWAWPSTLSYFCAPTSCRFSRTKTSSGTGTP